MLEASKVVYTRDTVVYNVHTAYILKQLFCHTAAVLVVSPTVLTSGAFPKTVLV